MKPLSSQTLQVSALLKNLYPTNPAAVDDELAEGFETRQ
jgi:hypothetical protein